MQVAYLIVDEMHAEHPELIKDQHWDDGVPDELPYTIAAEETRSGEPWLESTAGVATDPRHPEFAVLAEEENSDTEERADSKTLLDTNHFFSSNSMMNMIKDKRNDSSGSIFRLFSKSVSRNDLPRIESGVSVISSVIKNKRKRSRAEQRKLSVDRFDRKSSHPFLRRSRERKYMKYFL